LKKIWALFVARDYVIDATHCQQKQHGNKNPLQIIGVLFPDAHRTVGKKEPGEISIDEQHRICAISNEKKRIQNYVRSGLK
jgi:hypothetical protein